MRSLFTVFTLIYLILENMSLMGEKCGFQVIFDTCCVVYNWSISLLPPIVLDYLFGNQNFLREKVEFSFIIDKITI